MQSQAHGRNYLIGVGNPRPPREQIHTFRCTLPNGKRVLVKNKLRSIPDEPVAALLEEQGQWVFKAILDKNCLPEWASNYTLVPAKQA